MNSLNCRQLGTRIQAAANVAWVALCLALAAGCAAQNAATVSRQETAVVDCLLGAMCERLAVMPDVARAKWNAKQPIADPAREAVVIEQFVALGKEQGLDEEFLQEFIVAQIEAGKQVQETLFARWTVAGQGRFADAPDLAKEVRPKLDAIGRELIAAMVVAEPVLNSPDSDEDEILGLIQLRAKKLLAGDAIDDKVRETALVPLATNAAVTSK